VVEAMVKTTVYLDQDIALNLKQMATIHGRSQAELIRDALAAYTRQAKRPAIPGLGEFSHSDPTGSEHVKEIVRAAASRGKLRRTRSAGR
jgi:Ribbon-helix-helix protein, copG family